MISSPGLDLIPTITLDSPEDGVGGSIVGGTLYEIYGAATLETVDTLMFTFVSNISLDGNQADGVEGGVVAWGDLILNFGGTTLHDPNGTLFGVKFVNNNESGAPEIGLYQDISVKSVVVENRGPAGGLQGYIHTVEMAGKMPTFGDLGADPTPYFELAPYLENVIDEPGTKVADIQVIHRTEADLPNLGIDINTMVPGGSAHPLQVFSLEIPKHVLPGGEFTAHIGPECDNDIIAITAQIIPFPKISLEKSTNGEDADTVEEAAIVAAGEIVTWHYHLLNDGNIAFTGDEITLEDDQGVIPILDLSSDVGNDGILSPGEQWTYVGTEIGRELTFAVDFEVDANGVSLATGTTIDTEYQDIGITVSTPGHEHGAMLFDTAQITGGDHDLADPGTGTQPLGKVLILSEDGDATDPDDNAEGGVMRFDFDTLVGISGVHLLDIDASESVIIRTFDEMDALLDTYYVEGAGNNILQTAALKGNFVAALEVEFSASGAITGLEGDRAYSNVGAATVTGASSGFLDIMASDVSFYTNHNANERISSPAGTLSGEIVPI